MSDRDLQLCQRNWINGLLLNVHVEFHWRMLYADAAKTYFNSVSSLEKQKQSERYKEKSESQKKKNRLMRVSLTTEM